MFANQIDKFDIKNNVTHNLLMKILLNLLCPKGAPRRHEIAQNRPQ